MSGTGDAAARRRRAVLAGHRRDEADARALLRAPEGAVRAAALGALARMGAAASADVASALADADPGVRRRACQAAVATPGVDLVPVLADADPSVVEAAAWAVGERGAGEWGTARVLADLARIAADHPDPLCREAAVAALGAIGDPSGLPAILAATRDRPAIRRRAVISLAPFAGPEVDEALQRALGDRDWQVRQAAEDLLDVRPGERAAAPAGTPAGEAPTGLPPP